MGVIRGRVVDKETKIALKKATVELLGFSPARTVELDPENGQFEFIDVPLGRYRVQARAEFYESATYNNLAVVAGREAFITIEAKEKMDVGRKDPFKDVDLVNPNGNSANPEVLKKEIILMENTIGEQPFDSDKLNRFSGGRNDVARLAASYAGIANSNDSRNDIVVRGASPLGLQWLVEGIPVQNPNHVATIGTTSGFFPILNVNVIDNSDFRMGCFSGQYANATAGIFDIKFKQTNVSKTSLTAQLSINGGELMIESPFAKKRGSLVIAARYSLLKFMAFVPQVFGFGAVALPTTKDINYKLFYRYKSAEYSLFGFYGDSYYEGLATQQDTNSVFLQDTDADTRWANKNALVGGKLRYFFNSKTYMRVVTGVNITYADIKKQFYQYQNDSAVASYKGLNSTNTQITYSLNAFINHKFSSRANMRVGFLYQRANYAMYELENRYNFFPSTRYDFIGDTDFGQLYAQGEYRILPKVNLQLGLVGLYYSLNNEFDIEPRVNLSYFIHPKHQINLAYTIQHQTITSRLTFSQLSNFDAISGTTQIDRSNQQLPSIGNHYLMAEYLYQITDAWQVKISPYYKYWFRLPVQANAASGYSFYNADGDLSYANPDFPLQSTGTAQNYGVDFTLNHFFRKGFQLLASTSYFQSTYKGSDGIERNSRFNRNLISKLLVSKEWTISRQRKNTFFISSTFTYANGERYTPIDANQSQIFANEVFSGDFYSAQTPYYLRWDAKIGFRFNGKRSNHYFYFDVMNLTNERNVFTYRYDISEQQIKPIYQYRRLLEFFYRFQF